MLNSYSYAYDPNFKEWLYLHADGYPYCVDVDKDTISWVKYNPDTLFELYSTRIVDEQFADDLDYQYEMDNNIL